MQKLCLEGSYLDPYARRRGKGVEKKG